MPSRISGACNGCRTKKQKCSGDRSGCTQCHAASIQCTWPEQRKRGPAKGYIEGLEHRLHEAESLLLALLPIITTEQLDNATDSLNATSSGYPGLKSRDSASPSPRNMRSSPPVLNKKTGIDYWESFPLDSVDNIRKWQDDCAVHTQIPNTERSGSFRTSVDEINHSLVPRSNHNSRPSSMDLKREALDGMFNPTNHHNTNHNQMPGAQFRAMSSDSYRSGTSTPVNITSAARHSPGANHQHHQHQSPNQSQAWQNLSMFNTIPTPSNSQSSPNASNNISNNINANNNLSAEALLLQSFADNSWSQQNSLNNGVMGMGMSMSSGAGNGMESSPMEIDTGFFNNDLQRRLFW